MASEETFNLTKSKTYTLRLYILLHDIGTPVLRDLVRRLIGGAELKDHLEDNREYLRNLKIVSNKQLSTLFPPGNAAVSLEDFDISLLLVLLQSVCRLRRSENRIWIFQAAVTDQSLEANITRLRLYRNAIIHQPNTDFTVMIPGYSEEKSFKFVWNTIKKALLVLDNNSRPNLESRIDDVESLQLSESEQDAYKQKIERLEKGTHYNVFELTKLVLASIDEKLFVKTKAYEEAKEKLENNRIVVLKGNPGEGKTTMSRMLARDLGTDEKFINVSSRSDWRKVDITDDIIIIIDDIFGASVLDVSEFKKWQNVVSEIEKAVTNPDSKLRVVVTSRNYILNEALLRMYHSTFFTNENTVNISSEQLSDEEKEKILTNHLDDSERNVPTDFDFQKCIKCSNEDSDGNKLFPIGFPECARLFSQKDEMFNERYKFFQKPLYFIKKHMETVFESDELTFSAYFLIWAQKNHELHIEDIERPIEDTPDYVKTVLGKLQCSPEQYLSQIRRHLIKHKDGFLSFDESKGLYTFSHRVIADVVGLVAFERNVTLVLSCCDFDFAMRYIRLHKTPSDTLYIAPYRFSRLSRELVKFMTIDGDQIDGTVIQHEAFRNNEFCNIFFETLGSKLNSILSVPVQSLSAFFMPCDIDLKHEESRMASFSLYKGNGESLFAKLCFEKLHVPKEVLVEELYIATMIAIKFGSIETLKWLFQYDAKVADEMVIVAAKENKNKVVEFLRQKLDDGKGDDSRGWTIATKPNPIKWLIQNNKTAAVEIMIGRHDHFQILKNKKKGWRTVLHYACFSGKTEIAGMIISKYPFLDTANEQGYYPIHIAVKKGHVETVMFLLKIRQHTQAHRTLTLTDGKKNIKELSLLHIAIWNDNEVLAKQLAETDLFSNKVDAFERTAMLFALNGGKHKCIKTLLELKCINKETPDLDGNTPLHIAILKGTTHDSFLQYAIRLSEIVDVNKQNKQGETPITLADAIEESDIKKKLLDNLKIKQDTKNNENKDASQLLK